MKKHFLYLVAVTTMTLTSCNHSGLLYDPVDQYQMTLSFIGTGEKTISLAGTGPVTIYWKNDEKSDVHLLSTALFSFTHAYPENTGQTVVITIHGDNVTHLVCEDNQLRALDVSKNTALQVLNCSNNRLTALDVSKNTKLQVLNCSSNRLTGLDVSNNTALKELFLARQMTSSNSTLTRLIASNTALAELDCSGHNLSTLELNNMTALKVLHCNNNSLLDLDVSKIPNLSELYCNNNELSNLTVGANKLLKNLNCGYNVLLFNEINKLFESLHSDTKIKDKKIWVVGNPGRNHVNYSAKIAEDKGWTVN